MAFINFPTACRYFKGNTEITLLQRNNDALWSSVNNFVTTSLRYGNASTDVGTVLASKSWSHWISTQLARFRSHIYMVPYIVPAGPSE